MGGKGSTCDSPHHPPGGHSRTQFPADFYLYLQGMLLTLLIEIVHPTFHPRADQRADSKGVPK